MLVANFAPYSGQYGSEEKICNEKVTRKNEFTHFCLTLSGRIHVNGCNSISIMKVMC